MDADVAALEARLQELEARLRAVEDERAIRDLKAHYGQLADARYDRDGAVAPERLARLAQEIAALFTEDGVWDGGPALGVSRGRAEIEARFRAPTLRFSWHYFVKPRIEIDGARARGTWDLLAPCTTSDGRPHWMAGVEEDEYACVGGRWLHASLSLRTVLFAPHEGGWTRVHP